MKVLYVATVMMHFKSFHLPYMKWFQEQGWEVHVAANLEMDLPYCDKKHILPIERSPLKANNLRALRQLIKIIEEEDYDIIHCHTPMGGAITRLAVKYSKRSKPSVVYTAHGFHFFKGAPIKNWLLYYPIEKYLSKYTNVLITINKEDYLIATKKFKSNDIQYVRGVGVDTKKLQYSSNGRSKIRGELQLPEQEIVLLSVGELSERKNHETVIRALSKLGKSNVTYIICGQGKLESHLKKITVQLHVKVRFLGFREDIPDLCSAADIFVFPSYQEGLPVALMEAMSAGLPVVCSKIRGNTDLIDDGHGGYFIDPNNADDVAAGIKKMMESDMHLMGEINKIKVKDFDINIVKEEMIRIYKKLMK